MFAGGSAAGGANLARRSPVSSQEQFKSRTDSQSSTLRVKKKNRGMENKWIPFLQGLILGGAFAFALTLHFVSQNVATTSAGWERISNTWRTRAQGPEEKFNYGTIIYEAKPAGAPAVSLPILNGAADLSLTLGQQQNQTAEQPWPAYFIVGKVEPRTNVPGSMFQWIDLKTREKQGFIDTLPMSTPALPYSPEPVPTTPQK